MLWYDKRVLTQYCCDASTTIGSSIGGAQHITFFCTADAARLLMVQPLALGSTQCANSLKQDDFFVTAVVWSSLCL